MFERIKYPDGQIGAREVGSFDSITLKQRINSYEDLFYVRAIADILQNNQTTMELFIPCLFGQRSDRRFEQNQSFDLKLIAAVINDCKFPVVKIFDPHSDVAMALINHSVKISSLEYVQKVVHDLYHGVDSGIERGINNCNFTLVSPDAGAYKKIFDYGKQMNLPVVAAVKHRDENGKIDLTFMGDVKNKHCLIVDDLCDGGYTFELLGKALLDNGAHKVYLYVSHGFFSKGFYNLHQVIDHIYCTNSVKDIANGTIVKPRTLGDMEFISVGNIKDFVTQYKVI